ncbi:MAG: hypothetical protein ACREJC_05220, partial [Tepidisphaeraceae bacterium]
SVQCDYLHNSQLPPRGVEHPAKTLGKQALTGAGGAKSGAPGDEIAPELAEVVRSWTTLSADAQSAILAIVRQAKGRPR